MQPRDVGILQRYCSSWAYLRAERIYASPPTAVIPVLNHDSCAQECPPICWTRAVIEWA